MQLKLTNILGTEEFAFHSTCKFLQLEIGMAGSFLLVMLGC
jgi:hypothetical protein